MHKQVLHVAVSEKGSVMIICDKCGDPININIRPLLLSIVDVIKKKKDSFVFGCPPCTTCGKTMTPKMRIGDIQVIVDAVSPIQGSVN